MTTRHDDLLALAARARSLDDHGAHEQALEVYLALLEETRRCGASSPFTMAAAALAAQRAGRLEAAVDLAEQALGADALCVAAVEVLDAVACRVGALLAEPERPADDPATSHLYRLLVRAGRTDAGSVKALARYHEARGNRSVARALRETVEVLAARGGAVGVGRT
jgi:tetratricopeptide (TPR) repeat protein